jgi:hypothetical protein
MQNIHHVRDSYARWLDSEQYLQSRAADILLIGFQETLAADFALLKSILRLDERAQLPSDEVTAHRSPQHLDKKLSEPSIVNLKQWYAADYRFIDVCRTIREQRRPSGMGPAPDATLTSA